jgi:hypothetical protein
MGDNNAWGDVPMRMRYITITAAIVATFLFGWVFGNWARTGRVSAVLTEIFSDSKSTAAIAAAIFALLTLVAQYLVGSRQAIIGTRQAEAARISADAAMLNAQRAGDRAVATMRVQWIEALRNTLSEYHSILMCVDDDNYSDADDRRLSDLGTRLDLLLNLDEPKQLALWKISDNIFNLTSSQERIAGDPELVAAGRAVMKAEWEKIKRELRGTDAVG